MERRTFQTPLGEIWLLGPPEAWASEGPLIVVLRGTFADRTQFEGLGATIPELPVVFAPSPGTYCPLLLATSVGVFAAAYSAALNQLGRDVFLCGVSLGGLVALGVRSARLRGVLALDPPMTTKADSPLIPFFRAALARTPDHDVMAQTLWNIYGIAPDRHEARNYLSILDGLTAPAIALAGETSAAPWREGDLLPSVLGVDDEAALVAAGVSVRRLAGVGHMVGSGGGRQVTAALRELAAEA